MDTINRSVPEHVPDALVYDYDFYAAPRPFEFPHWDVAKMLQSEASPIFFTPHNGGHWVVTKASDTIEMFRRPDLFSSESEYNPSRKGYPVRHLPAYYDPPEHAEARKIMAPMFAPGAIAQMESDIRRLARDLVDSVYERGTCDFVHEIAEVFPVTIFLRLAKGRVEDRERMYEMACRFLRAEDPELANSGSRELAHFLTGMVDERRRHPGDDLVSRIVNGVLSGRRLTHEEALGAVVFVFLAGLDTVVAMISFVMHFLARNPAHYRRLVQNPADIAGAVEELMRISGVTHPERGVKRDIEFRGIGFKKYDRIIFLTQVAGLNDPEIKDPFTVDFERDVSPHIAFGAGPHRCLGSHLARVEIRTFLEEWVTRIPEFRMQEGRAVKILGGRVWQPESLPLAWDVRQLARIERVGSSAS